MNVRLIPSNPPERRPQQERRVYLHPGALWAEPWPGLVTTILGSCVSVCLWDPSTAIGGINHFILPQGGVSVSPRYGNHALRVLLDRMLQLGARQETLLSCVFGGSSILAPEGKGLGSRNVAVAFEFLQGEGIAVLRQDVEGRQGRKLTFRTSDGTTVIRKL